MKDLSKAGVEPDIADLIDDPILRLVLKRDGIGVDTVRRAVDSASQRLRSMKDVA